MLDDALGNADRRQQRPDAAVAQVQAALRLGGQHLGLHVRQRRHDALAHQLRQRRRVQHQGRTQILRFELVPVRRFSPLKSEKGPEVDLLCLFEGDDLPWKSN